jgi:acetyl-CoA C-acetyltransferase
LAFGGLAFGIFHAANARRMSMEEIVILSAIRTPIGAFQGGLASVPAPRLGAAAIRGALTRSGIAAAEVTDVYLGHVLQAGGPGAGATGSAPGGIIVGHAVCDRAQVCGSGLGRRSSNPRTGAATSIVVAGGMENMSAAPYLLPPKAQRFRLGHQRLVDRDLTDCDRSRFAHGELCRTMREEVWFTRERDAYAAESFRRANAAQRMGVSPGDHAVQVSGPKEVTQVVDEGRRVN